MSSQGSLKTTTIILTFEYCPTGAVPELDGHPAFVAEAELYEVTVTPGQQPRGISVFGEPVCQLVWSKSFVADVTAAIPQHSI